MINGTSVNEVLFLYIISIKIILNIYKYILTIYDIKCIILFSNIKLYVYDYKT